MPQATADGGGGRGVVVVVVVVESGWIRHLRRRLAVALDPDTADGHERTKGS